MKKEYQKPECNFVRMNVTDIVRTSTTPTGVFDDSDDME